MKDLSVLRLSGVGMDIVRFDIKWLLCGVLIVLLVWFMIFLC